MVIQNSFENTWWIVMCRGVSVELEKWIIGLFEKNAQCVFVLTTTSRYPVRPRLPPYGNGA
jgi:hypothetical protein